MHLSQARHETPLAAVASSAMLTYQSRATQPFSEEALHLLLQTAQARDEASDVTSLLIYRKGRHFHCLEGPTHAVKALWSAIQRGPVIPMFICRAPRPSPIGSFPNGTCVSCIRTSSQTRFTPIRCMSRLPSMRCFIAR